MKKLLAFLLLILALPAAAQDDDGFVWKFQPEVGSHWVIRSFTRTKMTELIPVPRGAQVQQKLPSRMKMDIGMTQTVTVNWDVLSKDGDGNFTVQFTYQFIDSSTSVSVNGKPAPANLQQAMQSNLAALSSKLRQITLRMKISPRAKILEVHGTEKFLAAILGSAGEPNSPVTKLLKPFLQKMYSKENLQSLFSASSVAAPTAPIPLGRGYSYAVAFPAEMPMPVAIYGTRILTSRDSGLATFKDSATLEIGSGPMFKGLNLPVNMKFDCQGNSAGTAVVEESSGLSRDVTTNTRLHGTITLSGKGIPEAMEVPLWMVMSNHTVVAPRS